MDTLYTARVIDKPLAQVKFCKSFSKAILEDPATIELQSQDHRDSMHSDFWDLLYAVSQDLADITLAVESHPTFQPSSPPQFPGIPLEALLRRVERVLNHFLRHKPKFMHQKLTELKRKHILKRTKQQFLKAIYEERAAALSDKNLELRDDFTRRKIAERAAVVLDRCNNWIGHCDNSIEAEVDVISYIDFLLTIELWWCTS